MAVETARRLACDSSVVTLIENDQGEPLNAGRKAPHDLPWHHRCLHEGGFRIQGGRDRGHPLIRSYPSILLLKHTDAAHDTTACRPP